MFIVREQHARLIEDGVQCLVLPTQGDAVELEADRVALRRQPSERRVEFEPDLSLADDVYATLEPATVVVARSLDENSIAWQESDVRI